MCEDIRDKPYITHRDILKLNFIRSPGMYIFRRHYRQGLRSHIMEVLTTHALEIETKGIMINDTRSFPRADPLKMLRIFKTRFENLAEAKEEIKRVKIIASYLVPDYIARSQEFLVDYIRHGKCRILLCGLQEYVKGVVLDPWGLLDKRHLISLLYDLGHKNDRDQKAKANLWIRIVRDKADKFIERIKQLIMEARFVPDLAGVGNLILTDSGEIKLVDINNISNVSFDTKIPIDDRGYPVCDKSVEALSLLEQKLLERSPDRKNPIYETFLDPARMDEVKEIEKGFLRAMSFPVSYDDESFTS